MLVPLNGKILIEIDNLSLVAVGRFNLRETFQLRHQKGKTTANHGPVVIGKRQCWRWWVVNFTPDSGDIRFKGESIPKMRASVLFWKFASDEYVISKWRYALLIWRRIRHIAFPLREHTTFNMKILISTVVQLKTASCGLARSAHLMPAEIIRWVSARRAHLLVAIALTLNWLCYDEPLPDKDPISNGGIGYSWLSAYDSLKLTSVVVTHDLSQKWPYYSWLIFTIWLREKSIGSGTASRT